MSLLKPGSVLSPWFSAGTRQQLLALGQAGPRELRGQALVGRASEQPSCHHLRPGGFSWPASTPAAGHSCLLVLPALSPRLEASLLSMGYQKKKKKKQTGYTNQSLGDLALAVSYRETNHTNAPFKAQLSPWPNHSAHPRRPVMGSFIPLPDSSPSEQRSCAG